MKDEPLNNAEADQKFDTISKKELTRRLKRPPTTAELINSDNDSDLVNEIMWQLINDLYNRIQVLEKKAKITK